MGIHSAPAVEAELAAVHAVLTALVLLLMAAMGSFRWCGALVGVLISNEFPAEYPPY